MSQPINFLDTNQLIALLEQWMNQQGNGQGQSYGNGNQQYQGWGQKVPPPSQGDLGITPSAKMENQESLGSDAEQRVPPAPSSSNGNQVVQTGTGKGHFFNVKNDSTETKTFAFSANSSKEAGYSNNTLAVMTLKPGETGTFESGDDVPGIRISSSGPNGETNPDQVLFEDTVEKDPMGSGDIVHNPDVSRVAGNVGYNGKMEYITINDGTRTIGDGTTTGSYINWNDDENPNRTTNPMNMALDRSNTYNIVFSDNI